MPRKRGGVNRFIKFENFRRPFDISTVFQPKKVLGPVEDALNIASGLTGLGWIVPGQAKRIQRSIRHISPKIASAIEPLVDVGTVASGAILPGLLIPGQAQEVGKSAKDLTRGAKKILRKIKDPEHKLDKQIRGMKR